MWVLIRTSPRLIRLPAVLPPAPALARTAFDEIIGVAKAYTTRVGMGPFPTELFDEMGDTIRNKGHEFGVTTGRPRRTGWFDAVIVRHAVRTNGLTALAVNKFDTLANLGDLKVCVAYRLKDGSILRDYPTDIREIEDSEPIYETLPGFDGDLSQCKTFEELPQTCQDYIKFLEKECECPIKIIGVGPGRGPDSGALKMKWQKKKQIQQWVVRILALVLAAGTAAFHADLFVNCFHVRKKGEDFFFTFFVFLGLRAAKWADFWG